MIRVTLTNLTKHEADYIILKEGDKNNSKISYKQSDTMRIYKFNGKRIGTYHNNTLRYMAT